MEIKINAIHFDATQKLEEFINKKVEKIAKAAGEIGTVDVNLKLVKPQTAMNKVVSISLNYLGQKVYVEKTADTFEDAVLQAVDSVKVQTAKIKDKVYKA